MSSMDIENSGLHDIIIESACDEADWKQCPVCEHCNWQRIVAVYGRGVCWVIFCEDCGKPFEARWNIKP